MQITRSSEAPDGPVDPAHFSGTVTRLDYGAIDAPAAMVLAVHFRAGARTDWHSHPAGQVLYVLDGTGRVGTRDGEVARIGAGDLVYAPPGEEHWHGAAEDAPVRHLAFSFGGTDWLERVEG